MRGALRIFLSIVLAMILFFISALTYTVISLTSVSSALKDNEKSYGVICDAGSTGTRIFVYSWINPSVEELIQIEPVIYNNEPVMKKVSPGLSTFGDKPEKAVEYIQPLLNLAEKHIPKNKLSSTPVFIFATAGMRLLPDNQKNAILHNLQTVLPSRTPMQVLKEHIRIIEGKWEGIYSWIAVNYALGKFKKPASPVVNFPGTNPSTGTQKTVGMIDMGGASMQIAFELPQNDKFMSSSVENINLGCQENEPKFKYKLFVTTFLGFGVNEGIKKYENYLEKITRKNNRSLIKDDCMPLSLKKIVKTNNGKVFVRHGTGNWRSCFDALTNLMVKTEKSDVCKLHENKKCFFGTIRAPEVKLSDMELYGFSEYWYSTYDVLGLGGNYNASIVANKSQEFCRQRWSAIEENSKKKFYPRADEERLKTQCFKSAWIFSVLHEGFSIDQNHNNFRSVSKIAGQEVQWALGAMIYHMRYFPLQNRATNFLVQKSQSSSNYYLWFSLFILLSLFLFYKIVFLKENKCMPFTILKMNRKSSNLRKNVSYHKLIENWSFPNF